MSEHVTIPRAEYDRLVADAQAWRNVAAWAERFRDRQASWTIAEAIDWGTVASRPDFAELDRRRGGTYHRCDFKTCTGDGTPHRSPASGAPISLCARHSHLGVAEDAPARMEVAA